MLPPRNSAVDRHLYSTLRRALTIAPALALVALSSGAVRAQETLHDGLLEKLRDKGVLTQEEYEQIKREREQEQQEKQGAEARKEATQTAEQAQKKEEAQKSSSGGLGEAMRGVRVKVGGFIELAGIYRSRNQTADVGSNYNTGIPFESNANHEVSEFRMSARQSRLSLLAEGNPNENTGLAAYFEADFLGAATTSNSAESNSYAPRLRQAYATYDRSDWGFEFLGGQSWSLLTLNKVGITPRQEQVPLTIDAQYNVGFNWTRNAQVRAVEKLGHGLTLGISAESPQAINPTPQTSSSGLPGGSNVPSSTQLFQNTGGSLLNSGANYSTDVAPDLVMKAALDPGWGHYEVFGLVRFFRDRVTQNGVASNSTTTGGGVGGGTILPLIPGKLDLQATALYGAGIGRYGSAQLPDVTFRPDGTLATVPELHALLGVVGHASPDWDYYLYGGTERAKSASYAGTGTSAANPSLGYGDNVLVDTKDCFYGGNIKNCAAQTASVWQIQLGTWWKFYKGQYGFMELGASYSYIRRDAFTGNAGAPSTDDNIVMTSFRYYPFQ